MTLIQHRDIVGEKREQQPPVWEDDHSARRVDDASGGIWERESWIPEGSTTIR